METIELIKRSRAGDKLAREQVIKANMPLVYSIVKRFAGRGYDAEDLSQIGAIGLIKAVDNFNVNFEVKFSTYAVQTRHTLFCKRYKLLLFCKLPFPPSKCRFLYDRYLSYKCGYAFRHRCLPKRSSRDCRLYE